MPSKKGSKKGSKGSKSIRKAIQQTQPSPEFAASLKAQLSYRRSGIKTNRDLKELLLANGNYPPDLLNRIEEHCNKFEREVIPANEPKWKNLNERIQKAGANGQWKEVESLATELLEDIHRVQKEHWETLLPDLSDAFDKAKTTFFGTEMQALRDRGQARTLLGKCEEAISDLTEALSYEEVWRAEDTDATHNQVALMSLRATCYEATGQIDKAVVDLDACCSAVSSKSWTGDSRPIKSQLLLVMARRKIGSPRPHYTEKEIEVLERKLGIGRRAKGYFSCYGCGKDKVSHPGVKLRLCGRCHMVWFCCRDCQVNAWKSHREECCEDLRFPIFLPDEYRKAIEDTFDSTGVGLIEDFSGLPKRILRDPSTGRMFESVTDTDVHFLPSDMNAGLASNKEFDFHNKIGRRIAMRQDGSRVERAAFKVTRTKEASEKEQLRAFAEHSDAALRKMSKERVKKQMGARYYTDPEPMRKGMEKRDFEMLKSVQSSIKEKLNDGSTAPRDEGVGDGSSSQKDEGEED